MVLFDTIGVIGIILLLVAFYMNVSKKIKRDSYTYNLLNIFGALGLAFYAWSLSSLVFIILQSIWALIALYFLIRKLIR